MNEINATFLEPFLIHPELLNWSPSSDAPDLVKKTIDVLTVLRDDPVSLKGEDIWGMIEEEGSQIGRKGKYFIHVLDTGGINRQLVEELGSRNPDLDLPSPELAWVNGLVHDLSKIYANYNDVYKQDDCELTFYFQARHLGLEDIAKKVAMHDGSEILKMIKEGEGFSNVGLYKEWTRVLNDPENPLYFSNIEAEFGSYLKGQGNLPLIILTLSDQLDDGKPFVDLDSLEEAFRSRTQDVENRHYWDKIRDGEEPSATGYAYTKLGAKQRFGNYLKLVKDLLERKDEEYRTFPELWKD